MSDLISRAELIKRLRDAENNAFNGFYRGLVKAHKIVANMPPAQPEFKPVTVEEFVKIMSENTFYGYMAWHGEAFTFMKEMGFEICKKTM